MKFNKLLYLIDDISKKIKQWLNNENRNKGINKP